MSHQNKQSKEQDQISTLEQKNGKWRERKRKESEKKERRRMKGEKGETERREKERELSLDGSVHELHITNC